MSCQDEQDTLKLALVYLQLVDEVGEFNRFPWGSVSYARTYESLSNAMPNRHDNFKHQQGKRGRLRDAYSLRAFPYTFQVSVVDSSNYWVLPLRLYMF